MPLPIDYKPHEGPTVQEYARPKRKVCDQCRWCKRDMLYMQRSSEILNATCIHPSLKSDSPFDNYLNPGKSDVLTPDWCPVEANEGMEWDSEFERWFDPKEPSDSPYDMHW